MHFFKINVASSQKKWHFGEKVYSSYNAGISTLFTPKEAQLNYGCHFS